MPPRKTKVIAFTNEKRIGIRISSPSTAEFNDILGILKFTLKATWDSTEQIWTMPLTMPKVALLHQYFPDTLEMSVALGAWEADRRISQRVAELEETVRDLQDQITALTNDGRTAQ